MIICLTFLIISIGTSYALIRYLSAPLTTLSEMQEQYGKGTLKEVELGRSLESAELGRSFHRMTKQIDELVEKNYAAELNEKTARLSALEAQLNPHFLYNTLQAIGSEALLNDQPGIYKMLTSLASNLRYSIKSANIVPLKDELQYTDNYILLQQVRLGDKLKVTRSVEEAALSMNVPKISLQSLVENSILHGFGDDRSELSVSITVSLRETSLMISVRDNGTGIPEDKLKQLRLSFHRQTLSDSSRQHIGLENLYHRIRLIYREGAALTIDSKTGEESYTEVSLMLPHADRVTQARAAAFTYEKEEQDA